MQKTTYTIITFTLICFFASPLVASEQVTVYSTCEEISQELIKGYAQKGIKLRQSANPNLRLAIGVVVEATWGGYGIYAKTCQMSQKPDIERL